MCDLSLGESEGVRGASFPTKRQLLLHQANSRQPTHGHRVIVRIVTTSNACILCGNMYTTKRYASSHLEKSLELGKCPRSKGSAVQRSRITSPPYS
eukprot:3784643-Pyramimonas_sp.AAC.1